MNIHLVIGASGLVGDHLVRSLKGAGCEVVATYFSHPIPGLLPLDICDIESLDQFIKRLQPGVVYLPAALPNVNYCELHPEETYRTNVCGVTNVIHAVNQIPAKLVYFSSDYIFDGKAGPYKEEHPANPICEYGRQKLMAEHAVACQSKDFLIIRTNGVFGYERQRKNFIYHLIDTLAAKQILKVPIDQFGTPTYAPNLAQAVIELAIQGSSGVFHVAGLDYINRYEFASKAAAILGLDSNLIQPFLTRDLAQSAPRPLNAGLVTQKAASTLTGVSLVGYETGLQMMAEVIKANS